MANMHEPDVTLAVEALRGPRACASGVLAHVQASANLAHEACIIFSLLLLLLGAAAVLFDAGG